VIARGRRLHQHDGVEWAPSKRPRTQCQGRSTRHGPAPTQGRGGSTITQQLAKNLLLSGERTLLRKGQELVLAHAGALLSKQRILEIYLNSVEWGEGVFGAEAAARHYRKSAAQLAPAKPPAWR
jgi:monofunctional biosynthetic peptidoglycan transglycosylase